LRAKGKERRSSIVCRSKERENYRLIYERERRKTPCRLPKPEPKAEYQCRALLLSMGAGEADGGRRGRWGQARPMGAASHRPHARVHQHRRLRKPPGQIPSQQDHIVDLLDDEEKSFRYLSNNSVK